MIGDAAGHATETFQDWVVGHGELWSAQLLAAAVRQVWMVSTVKLGVMCAPTQDKELNFGPC